MKKTEGCTPRGFEFACCGEKLPSAYWLFHRMKYGVGPPEEVESRRVEYRGMIEPLQEQGDFLLWAEEPVAVLQEMLFNLEEPVVVTPLLDNLMTPLSTFHFWKQRLLL